MGLNMMISILVSQIETLVKKPLCPTLIHDETNRLVIILCMLVPTYFILWKVMRYFNGR